MKKLLVGAASMALLFGSAMPALAWGSSDVAFVRNSSTAVSSTGGNGQGNTVTVNKAHADEIEVNGNNTMTTGSANSYAGAVVVANTHVGCGCDSRHHNDVAFVANDAGALSTTGDNGQGNGVSVKKAHAEDVEVSGNNVLTTGNAKSTSHAWTVVNTHISLGGD